MRASSRLSRPSCLLCEENLVNATLEFSSPTKEYTLLDSEGSGIGYNYSYWASRCAGNFFTFLQGIKVCMCVVYIITKHLGIKIHCYIFNKYQIFVFLNSSWEMRCIICIVTGHPAMHL